MKNLSLKGIVSLMLVLVSLFTTISPCAESTAYAATQSTSIPSYDKHKDILLDRVINGDVREVLTPKCLDNILDEYSDSEWCYAVCKSALEQVVESRYDEIEYKNYDLGCIDIDEKEYKKMSLSDKQKMLNIKLNIFTTAFIKHFLSVYSAKMDDNSNPNDNVEGKVFTISESTLKGDLKKNRKNGDEFSYETTFTTTLTENGEIVEQFITTFTVTVTIGTKVDFTEENKKAYNKFINGKAKKIAWTKDSITQPTSWEIGRTIHYWDIGYPLGTEGWSLSICKETLKNPQKFNWEYLKENKVFNDLTTKQIQTIITGEGSQFIKHPERVLYYDIGDVIWTEKAYNEATLFPTLITYGKLDTCKSYIWETAVDEWMKKNYPEFIKGGNLYNENIKTEKTFVASGPNLTQQLYKNYICKPGDTDANFVVQQFQFYDKDKLVDEVLIIAKYTYVIEGKPGSKSKSTKAEQKAYKERYEREQRKYQEYLEKAKSDYAKVKKINIKANKKYNAPQFDNKDLNFTYEQFSAYLSAIDYDSRYNEFLSENHFYPNDFRNLVKKNGTFMYDSEVLIEHEPYEIRKYKTGTVTSSKKLSEERIQEIAEFYSGAVCLYEKNNYQMFEGLNNKDIYVAGCLENFELVKEKSTSKKKVYRCISFINVMYRPTFLYGAIDLPSSKVCFEFTIQYTK